MFFHFTPLSAPRSSKIQPAEKFTIIQVSLLTAPSNTLFTCRKIVSRCYRREEVRELLCRCNLNMKHNLIGGEHHYSRLLLQSGYLLWNLLRFLEQAGSRKSCSLESQHIPLIQAIRGWWEPTRNHLFSVLLLIVKVLVLKIMFVKL